MASAEDDGDNYLLYGGRNGSGPVLARIWWRAVHGVVLATGFVDHFPAEPGGSRRSGGDRRSLVVAYAPIVVRQFLGSVVVWRLVCG